MSRTGRSLRQVSLEHLPLIAAVTLFAAGRAAVQAWTGSQWQVPVLGVLRDSAYWFVISGLVAVLGSSLVFLWRAWRGQAPGDPGGAGPLARWRTHLAERFRAARVLGAAAAIVGLVTFLQYFVAVKTAIPAMHPFAWDRALEEADRAVHLGHDPWRLLQPVFGHPALTHFFDVAYALWYVVIMGTLLWQCWSARRRLRARFLLAFVLCWVVLGCVLATLFSSAGPAYFQRFAGRPDPYLPLMSYLRHVDAVHPVVALKIQRYLLEGYLGTAVHSVQGISAMPSMHISMAVLVTLLAARYPGRLRAVLYGAFAVLILLGSVLLAWHYALDGYVAVLLTVGCWWATGRMVDRYARELQRSGAASGAGTTWESAGPQAGPRVGAAEGAAEGPQAGALRPPPTREPRPSKPTPRSPARTDRSSGA